MKWLWLYLLGMLLLPTMSFAAPANWQAVELVRGLPNRPYEELGTIWESASTRDEAVHRAKKSAYKQGADAIIDYREDTTKKYVIPLSEFGTDALSNPRPLIRGEAVRWK